jgi:mycothiol synthase
VASVTERSEPAARLAPRPVQAKMPGRVPRVEISSTLPAADVAAVAILTEAATEADGVRPLSEHVSLHLRNGGEGPDLHILLLLPPPAPAPDGAGAGAGLGLTTTTGEIVVGYAHLDPTDAVAGSAAELVVHPAFRGHGYGRLLVEAAGGQTPDGRVRLWAHGDHPAARQLAESMGFRVVRRLEQLRRSLYSPLPGLHLPETVRIRAFRPGEDDRAWLELNARAFAGHPEQGSWTAQDLVARMQESWFAPEGFLIAEEDGPEGPGMVAFHWTKIHGGDSDPPHVHPPAAGSAHGHEPIGEVYVVGVDPAHQGRGLGRSITVAGLRWLRARGLPQAMLYVEADNEPALAVYRSLGFTHWDTDVMFYRSVPNG